MGFLETLPLEVGAPKKILIREEEVPLFSSGANPYRILYASDLHFSRGNQLGLIKPLVKVAEETRPDLILLGGDLVDNPQALPSLIDCARELSRVAPLAGVAGNHDQKVGLGCVRKALEKGGGLWLGKESFSFKLAGRKVRVDGCLKQEAGLKDPKLLCTHFPGLFPMAARRGYSLVLAGHLHGCQFVFWQKGVNLYPGAWFYRWNGLRFKDGPCRLLVSRGVSDSLPIRWNCPREVLLCKVF